MQIWRCDQQTSNAIVHDFFESKHFRDDIQALPGAFAFPMLFQRTHNVLHIKCMCCDSSAGTFTHHGTIHDEHSILAAIAKQDVCADAYDTLQRLKYRHDLVVVTSRQFAIQDATLQWLDQHFPDTFTSVHFGNHFAKAGNSRKKSEICRDIQADVLIDDNPTYAYDCASAGMQVLLFNWRLQYPWSQQPDQCDSFQAAHSRSTCSILTSQCLTEWASCNCDAAAMHMFTSSNQIAWYDAQLESCCCAA